MEELRDGLTRERGEAGERREGKEKMIEGREDNTEGKKESDEKRERTDKGDRKRGEEHEKWAIKESVERGEVDGGGRRKMAPSVPHLISL